jgi:hypothetical protein
MCRARCRSLSLVRASAFILSLFAAPMVYAAPIWEVTIINGSGMVVDDLHLVFRGTGGITNVAVTFNPDDAGDATESFLDNMITIDWGFPGFPVGANIELRVSSPGTDIIFDSGFWTLGKVNVAGVDADDVEIVVAEPHTMAFLLIGVVGHALRRSAQKHRAKAVATRTV